MLSVRRDQENTIKAVHPKTPGFAPKTPAPRDRAPLGAKSTNVRAQAQRNAGPGKLNQLGDRTSLRPSANVKKSKLSVHAEASRNAVLSPSTDRDIVDSDTIHRLPDELPEVEYCPPKVTPLLDVSDDEFSWGPDTSFPTLERENPYTGWIRQYQNQIGEDGLTRREREELEEEEAISRILEEYQPCLPSNDEERSLQDLDLDSGIQDASAKSLKGQFGRSDNEQRSILSHQAAHTLSQSIAPHFTAPTLATKAKRINATNSMPPKSTGVAAGQSHKTIGYAHGRQVSRQLHGDRPVSRAPPHREGAKKHHQHGSNLEHLLQQSETEKPLFAEVHGLEEHFFEEDTEPFELKMSIFHDC